MALSVSSRPTGYIIGSAVTATMNDDLSANPKVIFTKTNHGLSTNDVVYIRSQVQDYNGFWFVDVASSGQFYIKQTATGAFQDYISADGETCTYQISQNSHGWSCVHLPIVYKLSSTLWPTNSVDTTRTVSSFTNDNGYVNLNLSGDIKATGTANELEWVKISGSNGLDGIYQIINWISDTDITINLAYSAGYSFAGATVQFYYNNYHAVVRIYAGLNSAHYWAGQKAYELIAEKKAVPDVDGIITINIAEELKSKLEIISNNLQLGTLPNNIDAFCMFYIEYAESYDDSNGYTLGTVTESYTSDQNNFEGYAVNAKLPFKNKHAGYLSEYVLSRAFNSVNAAKFLTEFTIPTLFPGYYFDLSWIRDESIKGGAYGNTLIMVKETYLEGVGTGRVTENIIDNDEGIYRTQLTQIGTEDKQIVYIADDDHSVSLLAPSAWTNGAAAFDSKTSTRFIELNLTAGVDLSAYMPAVAEGGQLVSLTVTIDTADWNLDPGVEIAVIFEFTDSSGVAVDQDQLTNIILDSATAYLNYQSFNYLIILNEDAARFQVRLTRAIFSSPTTTDVEITIQPSNFLAYSPNSIHTEQKQIDIDTECYQEYIYLSWLNPDGGYDYWLFTGAKEVGTDILKDSETNKNLFADLQKNYGEFADTDRHQTSRESRRRQG